MNPIHATQSSKFLALLSRNIDNQIAQHNLEIQASKITSISSQKDSPNKRKNTASNKLDDSIPEKMPKNTPQVGQECMPNKYMLFTDIDFNNFILNKLQSELFMAQNVLKPKDIEHIQLLQKTYSQRDAVPSPALDIMRSYDKNVLTVVIWKKLESALEKILVKGESTYLEEFGLRRAFKAIQWIHHLLHAPETNRIVKPRDVIHSKTFTLLCAQAIIAQKVLIAPSQQSTKTFEWNNMRLISETDLYLSLNFPELFEKELSVSFFGLTRPAVGPITNPLP